MEMGDWRSAIPDIRHYPDVKFSTSCKRLARNGLQRREPF